MSYNECYLSFLWLHQMQSFEVHLKGACGVENKHQDVRL
jgi:hypothetical protein